MVAVSAAELAVRGAETGCCASCARSWVSSTVSSQRNSASVMKIWWSSTRRVASSVGGVCRRSRVMSCSSCCKAWRWCWMSSETSRPGISTATASFITSSSRPRCSGVMGERHHRSSSWAPELVNRHNGAAAAVPTSLDPLVVGAVSSISPSRFNRCSVVETCPILSGQVRPMVRSKSFLS